MLDLVYKCRFSPELSTAFVNVLLQSDYSGASATVNRNCSDFTVNFLTRVLTEKVAINAQNDPKIIG